ncbi:Maf family nucleotide pyrophosphatase [Flammeovirga sp. EKP202]|uniref:Maf family nucleotide pyrophosphatase n=1 Tax=Flammeovirga sp. EKP202 TaxID=2770592 RepID=UPI00165FD369|nr:Maf family nucleotide pyrophosphatase [Flammeovirga sp. EKP202]MBD0401331.1 septum formation protein Maf [Flammeovirga sp. EKP202]
MIDLKGKKIILASKSPRRASLLSEMDIPFEVKVREVDESYPDTLPPEEVAEYIAKQKAKAFDDLKENEIAIFSDTVVVNQSDVLGKPKDFEEAKAMLQGLSGNSHTVYSAVCIKTSTQEVSFTDRTLVTFLPMSEEVLNYYINEKQPFDKAGAYGIQEWIGMTMIQKIEGSYFTVMGLPTAILYQKLNQIIKEDN